MRNRQEENNKGHGFLRESLCKYYLPSHYQGNEIQKTHKGRVYMGMLFFCLYIMLLGGYKGDKGEELETGTRIYVKQKI